MAGSSGSIPGPVNPAFCHQVEADGFLLLLDVGNGSFGSLQRYPLGWLGRMRRPDGRIATLLSRTLSWP
jgi:hypothetical protein